MDLRIEVVGSRDDAIVDFVLHGYFFRTEWISKFWALRPASLDYGEDFHFSAALRHAGIQSYVPRIRSDEDRGNLRRDYGSDANATYLRFGVSRFVEWTGNMLAWAAQHEIPLLYEQ